MSDEGRWVSTFRKPLRWLLASILVFNILSLLWVVLYAFIPIPTTKLMQIESRRFPLQYKWVSLEQIADPLELAVMCAEDQYFLLHFGLDFQSIKDAEVRNEKGGKVRGASTLTQQVAKNAFLWPDRSYIRKAFELYFSLLIEMIWSKERIMEVYLNVAEFGKGVFGAEAAARYYFEKPADGLTVHQAAQLAALLPNPKVYAVHRPSTYVANRVRWIEKQMSYWGNQMTYDKEFVREMLE